MSGLPSPTRGSACPSTWPRGCSSPYFTTKQRGEGTGLGLASVYATVTGAQGAISVYSEVGKGTEIRVYLPLTSSGAPAKQTAPPPTKPLAGNPLVLVIEDEVPVRKIATLLLESLGCRVIGFETSIEAVEFFQASAQDVDVVLLDMCMPHMDGTETFHALRAHDPTAKIVLASGYTLLGAAEQLLEEGAYAFIEKPYRRADLEKALRPILEGA